MNKYRLYQACKHEVAECFGDHGMSLVEMWKAANKDSFWYNVCLSDYFSAIFEGVR